MARYKCDSMVTLDPRRAMLIANDLKWRMVKPSDFLDDIDDRFAIHSPDDTAFGSKIILAKNACEPEDPHGLFTEAWTRRGLKQLRTLADGTEERILKKAKLGKDDKLHKREPSTSSTSLFHERVLVPPAPTRRRFPAPNDDITFNDGIEDHPMTALSSTDSLDEEMEVEMDQDLVIVLEQDSLRTPP